MYWKPSRQDGSSLQAQITTWMLEKIETNEWAVGMKLPSQRQLALQLGVNRSTIQQVLDELKADGVLQSRVGSGTFVASNPWQPLLHIKQPNWSNYIKSSIYKPNHETIQLINEYEQYEDMIRLGTGELAPELIPSKDIQRSMQHLVFEQKSLGYSSPQGNLKLREALCNYLKQKQIYASPDEICIVSGALQALQLLAIGLLEPGATVFQEHASYLNSVHPFQSAGMIMKQYSIDNTLQNKLKNRQFNAILYSNPTLNNPTGRIWTIEERQQVITSCQSLKIPIVEDDVYSELLFEDAPPSLKSIDENGQVLYIGSVSKTFSAGLRIGWIVGPKAVITRLADIKMQTDYGSSAFSQELVTYWLNSGQYELHTKNLRNELQNRAQFTEKILTNHFQSIATWETPRGGFYIWLRFNKPIITKQLFRLLINEQILINPGYIYDINDAYHIRLSYAYATYEQLELGLKRLSQIIKPLINSNLQLYSK